MEPLPSSAAPASTTTPTDVLSPKSVLCLAPVFALAGLLALAACGDPVNPPPRGGEGIALSFSDGGSYQTEGAPQITGGELDAADFAIAFPDTVGGLVIATFKKTEGTRGDLFILQLVQRRTEVFNHCGLAGDCHGRILEGIDAANLWDLEEFWEITEGSVTMEEAGPERVVGTVKDLTLTLLNDGTTTRTIQEGSFHLALLSEGEGVAVMECFLTRVTGGTCE